MPTLDESWSPKVRTIGDLERQDHWYLTSEHNCLFFGEYTSGVGYSHSSTNQIIANIKKRPNLRGTSQWRHKVHDMNRVASAIRGAINAKAYGEVTLVPIPPSKLRDDPDYDPRMTEIANGVSPFVNVRELITQAIPRRAQHESSSRLTPEQLLATLAIDQAQCAPQPQNLILVDDVLTTGCTFVACSTLLRRQFPDVPVWGLFAARRVLDRSSPFEALGDL